MATNFLRREAVCQKTALGSTTIYEKEVDGTFPGRVKLTGRAARWAEHEVDEYNRAVLAGASDAALRRMVRDQIKRRKLGAPA